VARPGGIMVSRRATRVWYWRRWILRVPGMVLWPPGGRRQCRSWISTTVPGPGLTVVRASASARATGVDEISEPPEYHWVDRESKEPVQSFQRPPQRGKKTAHKSKHRRAGDKPVFEEKQDQAPGTRVAADVVTCRTIRTTVKRAYWKCGHMESASWRCQKLSGTLVQLAGCHIARVTISHPLASAASPPV